MPTILIGADLCPIGDNQTYFEEGRADTLFNDLLTDFESADLVVANLECPLINQTSPIPKTGPSFGVPVKCINGIRAAGIDILGLANNHIMDHDSVGLESTLEACSRADIDIVGAGMDLERAGRMVVKLIGGVRICFMAVAEQEFSIASDTSAGANPVDPIQFVRSVEHHRSEFDSLIVLYHGAAEFHAPTPAVQNTCRFMIEQGADAVIVQHPHVLGGWEDYRSGHIVYGQGALIMDEAVYRDRDSFHEGFLVKLTLQGDEPSEIDFIPFRQSSPGPGARKLSGADKERFHSEMTAKKEAVSNPERVKDNWHRFCKENRYRALSSLFGHGRLLRFLNRNGWIERNLLGSQRLLGVRNMVTCETHREKLITILKDLDR